MTDREKLIAWIRDVSKFHEEVKEKWILGGKQGERPSLIESVADHLIANGVVVREKGEWMEMVDCVEDGYTGEYYEEIYYNCLNCDYATTENTPFCPNCGADMRKGENG